MYRIAVAVFESRILVNVKQCQIHHLERLKYSHFYRKPQVLRVDEVALTGCVQIHGQLDVIRAVIPQRWG